MLLGISAVSAACNHSDHHGAKTHGFWVISRIYGGGWGLSQGGGFSFSIHGVHLEFACAVLASGSRSWRIGHRKIETPDSASQNASSPPFSHTKLSASAKIEHIFLGDQTLDDTCRFRLACPRIRRVGIPASMEVLPEQLIFFWPGGFWFWANLKITASV